MGFQAPYITPQGAPTLLEQTGLRLSSKKVLPRNPSLHPFPMPPPPPGPHGSLTGRMDAETSLGAVPHLIFPVQGTSIYWDSVLLSLKAMMLCPLRNRSIKKAWRCRTIFFLTFSIKSLKKKIAKWIAREKCHSVYRQKRCRPTHELAISFHCPLPPFSCSPGLGPTAFPAHTIPSVANRERTLRDPRGAVGGSLFLCSLPSPPWLGIQLLQCPLKRKIVW